MFEEVMQSKENYKLDTFTVTVTDSGPQAMKEFWHFYCNTCDKNPNIVTAFFKQCQEDLGVNAKVNDLINNFDVITIPTEKSVYMLAAYYHGSQIVNLGPILIVL